MDDIETLPQLFYGYVRVSTKYQNLDREIIEIKQYCKSHNIKLAKIYQDKISGSKFERNGYQQMKRKLKAGDTLIITELDRFGRKKEEILKELKYFRDKKIHVQILEIPTTLVDYSAMDNYMAELLMDTVNNLMIELYSAMAEMEMEKRRKRQREGLDALRDRGEWYKIGRPAKIGEEEFVQAWNTAQDRGMTKSQLAEQLNVSRSTIRNYKNKYIHTKRGEGK